MLFDMFYFMRNYLYFAYVFDTFSIYLQCRKIYIFLKCMKEVSFKW